MLRMEESKPRSAKEIFMYYGGSFFFMHRQGDYAEYKSHGVSHEKEEVWREELRRTFLDELDQHHQDAHLVSKYSATISFPAQEQLLDALTERLTILQPVMDSFCKILCAEKFVEILAKQRLEDERRRKLVKLTRDLLNAAQEHPETAIKERARKSLAKLK
jgi:hypothetical protein